jgi:tRNA threonylcarbamoyladenosine biosynthesis protein TsaB
MLTLAIDTATEVGCVCLYSAAEGLIGEVRLGTRRRHSEKLLETVDFLLSKALIGIEDVDFFTVSIGPGSFTGLRVGLSTVKGLSFASKKPVVAVSTLEAFAFMMLPTKRLICPLIDARKGEVYGAVFKQENNELIKIVPESVASPEKMLSTIQDETVFFGSGALLYRDLIIKHLGKKAFFRPIPLNHPMGSTVALCGFRKAERGEFSDPERLVPLYLRKSEAEIRYKPPNRRLT